MLVAAIAVAAMAMAAVPFDEKSSLVNLPKRELLLLRFVFALPRLSRMGLACRHRRGAPLQAQPSPFERDGRALTARICCSMTAVASASLAASPAWASA